MPQTFSLTPTLLEKTVSYLILLNSSKEKNLVAEKISSNLCFRAFPSLNGQLDSSWWQKTTLLSTDLETPRALIISRSISAHLELRLTFSPCLCSTDKENPQSSY